MAAKKKSEPSTDLDTSWGRCDDAELLAAILRDYPHARVFHESVVGNSCGFPLWDLRPDETGRWRTSMGTRDRHRMVCGAPTRRVEPPYCDACRNLLGKGVFYTPEERRIREEMRRRHHAGRGSVTAI